MIKRTTFDLLLPVARGQGEPLRIQVLRELRAAIHSGRVPGGMSLPASRALAADLGVSRGIVVAAYEQLVAEGYLTTRRGSATRVAARGSADPVPALLTAGARVTVPPRFDFRPGVPDLSLFPRRAWLRALRRTLTASVAASLDYPDPAGVAPAREAIASYLNRSRATVADPRRVVLCTGFAQAARLVAETLRSRGVRRIAVEDPGHAEQCADIRAAGLELVPVPVDEGGLCVDRLADRSVGAVLVTPAHQYPTGAVLAADRRAALLEWARRRGGFVLEDDYDAEYRFDRDPVGAMQGLAPERVVYMGSASKMLVPSLRQGWLVLPAELVDGVMGAKLSADRGSPALEQFALATFLDAGELDRHLRRTRPVYRKRRDAMVSALRDHLPDMVIRGVAAGLHLLLDLPGDLDEDQVVAAAAERRIRVYGGKVYHADRANAPPSLLLGYGGVGERGMARGIGALAEAVGEARRRARRRRVV
jgi:GntR family transcriptional regulator/MocR family aminotransferase